MDNVQKHDNFINTSSSQTFRSITSSSVLCGIQMRSCALHCKTNAGPYALSRNSLHTKCVMERVEVAYLLVPCYGNRQWIDYYVYKQDVEVKFKYEHPNEITVKFSP
jgi:hypothetical protein